MAFAYPSATNSFIPSFEATGHLAVAYSRNPKDFTLNKYISLTPVKKTQGYYLKINAEMAAKVENTDLADLIWNDGDDAPSGDWNLESHSFFPYNTNRFVTAFRLGYKTNEQADWKILSAHSEIHAQRMMTARTVKVLGVALDTSTYDASHYDTAANWITAAGGSGTYLDAGTPTNPLLKFALRAMSRKIHKDTLGAVKPKDLVVVVNPNLAGRLSTSQEVHTYLKESRFALEQLRGDAPNQNSNWELPETLYGYKIVVEDCVKTTNKKGATKAATYALGDTSLLMCSRPGGLTSMAGGPSYSSFHVFSYEEMTVEQKDDPDNRRIKARIVEDYDVKHVATAATALCTSATS